MLHSIKRATVGSFAVKSVPENAEYQQLRGHLTTLQKSLQNGLIQVETAKKRWAGMTNDAEAFYHTMGDTYPSQESPGKRVEESELLCQIRSGADIMHGEVRANMAKLTSPSGGYATAVNSVMKFVVEVKTVLSDDCGRVDTAHRDMAMYSQKVDKLQQHQSQNHANAQSHLTKLRKTVENTDEKCERNMQKLSDSTLTYESRLDETVAKMNALVDKAPAVFDALFIAYTSFNAGMCATFDRDLKQIVEFCSDREKQALENLTGTSPGDVVSADVNAVKPVANAGGEN